jgi:mannose-6-phosphate isomerase-like protein (cupin superfamily)
MKTPDKINLAQKMELVDKLWSPKIIGELNDSYVKLARVKGEYCWHSHAEEDELFLVLSGELKIELRSGELLLGSGEMAIIPQGMEHKPVAVEEAQILLIERKSTVNTGDTSDARKISADELEWL